MRMRLDQALVTRGLVASRSRAVDLIKRGEVRVDGVVASKAGAMVGAGDTIEVPAKLAAQASRAAGKLEAALDAFGFSATGRIALDIGASTGGFTQVMLDGGAAKVYAVDVGHGQLLASLAADARVTSLEGVDARTLSRDLIGEPVTAIVADVSFISLTLVLPQALLLATKGCWLVVLVKPQFELGRAAIGKGGVVKDQEASRAATEPVARLLEERGWRVTGVSASPLPGKEGNREWLLGAVLDE